jgi:hypothetical protein
MGSAFPLCRWPSSALRFSLTGPPTSPVGLAAPSLRVSPPLKSDSARPSRPEQGSVADSSPGLLFSTAHEGTKVHFPRALPARYVPPSGFGHPLGGFLPSNPCRSCFVPTALLRFALRSFPLSQGTPAFPPPRTHLPFAAALLPLPRAGTLRAGFWASPPARVPGRRARG